MFLLSGFPLLDQAEENDAVNQGWSPTFEYCFTVDAKDTAGNYMEAPRYMKTYNTKSTTTLSSSNLLKKVSDSNSSWDWNTTTGYGPFNSFYGVFNSSNGTFMGILNPNDLTKYVKRCDGNTSLNASSDIQNHNVMWVLPKVYIYSLDDWKYVITNMPKAGAYNVTMNNNTHAKAHVVGGTVYNAIGFAVYQSSISGCNYSNLDSHVVNNISDTSKKIMSSSNKDPEQYVPSSHSVGRTMVMNTVFKDGVNATAKGGMFWNYYQYSTYCLLAHALGMGADWYYEADGEWDVMNHDYSHTTGEGNTVGPYKDYSKSKAFIEFPWSGYYEYIDDSAILSNATSNGAEFWLYVGQNAASNIVDNSSSGKTKLLRAGYTTKSGGKTVYGGASWDSAPLPYKLIMKGGATYDTVSKLATEGIYYYEEVDDEGEVWTDYDHHELSFSIEKHSRMIALFASVPTPSVSLSISSSNTSYGTVSPASYTIPEGSSITVSSNTIKYNNTTIITASAKSATAQYTYAFSKWQYLNGSTWTDLTGTKIISANTSIKAVFTATVNTYQVKYYNGSTQITSYTENVQYNGHITHASYSVSGKVFCGWYKNSSSFTSANLVTTSTAVTGALTLYAYMVDTLAFTTSPVANASITYASDLGSVLFDALGSESAYRVQWDFGDGTYGDEVVMYHHYEEPGTYNVLLTVYNYDGEMDSKGYVVAVYDMESPPQNNNDTLLIVGGVVVIVIAGFIIFRPF